MRKTIFHIHENGRRIAPSVPAKPPTIEEKIEAIFADVPANEWDKLPRDMSDRLDYYLYQRAWE